MKPIFGNIVERNSNTSFIPKDEVKITIGESFPSSKKILQRKDKKFVARKSNLSNSSASCDKETTENIMNEIENRNSIKTDYGQANLDIVLGMSSEEVGDAVAEFSSLFSEKTLEFLKNKALSTINNTGNVKLDSKGIQNINIGIKDNLEESHILGNYKNSIIPKQPILHNNNSQNPIKEYLPLSKPTTPILNSKSKKIDIVNKINNCPIPVTSEDFIASTLEELSIKEKKFKLQENKNNFHSNNITPLISPPNVTADSDNNIINKNVLDPTMSSTKKKTAPSQILRISTDRFNLEGNRVLNRLETIEILKETLSLPDITFLRGISTNGIDRMAKACVDTMFNCGFAVEDEVIQDQPQNELLHHERDFGVLGYTLADISDMFRSEAPKKRSMALRIFSGILRNRDAVVSSECYNYSSLSNQFLLTSKDSISSVDKFYMEYENLILSGKIILENENIWDHSFDAVFNKKLRRLLSFTLLVLSAVDLPPDLPVLLLMALQMKDLQKTAFQNDVVICLKNYLCSDTEEKAAQYIWSPFDGDRSCPILPMPHVRRSEVSYEEHIGDCSVKLHKQYEETDENNEDGKFTNLPIYQAFALRCRFGRVDVMVAESTLVPILVSVVDEGVKLHSFLEKFSSQTNSLLQTSLLSIYILCTLSRQGNEHTIQTIQESVIKKLWKKFTRLDSDISQENIDILSQASWNSLLTSWWRLLTELSRRDPTFLEWMWKNGIGVKILGLILRFESRRFNPLFNESFEDVVWAMRLWRIGLCSGFGLDQVSEFLLAVQIPRLNQESDNSNVNINNYRTGLSIRNDLYTLELFQLLEQATISVSKELFDLKFEITKSTGSSSSSILISGCPLNFKNSIELLNLSRILVTCSLNLLPLYLSFVDRKEDVKFLSSLGHFVGAVIGVRHDDISSMNYSLLVERNTGLVETCLNFDLKFRSSMGVIDTKKDDDSKFRTADSASINTMLLQLLSLVESFLSNPILDEISSKIISKLNELEPSTYLYDSSTKLINVRNELAMRRLLMSILSRKWNSSNPEELLLITRKCIDELKKCESQTTSVSEGLIAWEISSIRSSRMLVSLYIIHMAYINGVVSGTDWIYSLMGCLRCLGQGMTESIVVILNQTVQDILKSSLGHISDDNLVHLQESVIIAILGEDYKTQISNKSDKNIISSIYNLFYGGNIISKNHTEDINSVIYNSKFPLQRDWMFNILCELKGVNFCLWLRLLGTLENDNLRGISGYNSGRKLYKVIKTAKAVHSFRWTLFEAKDAIGGVELEIPTPIPGSLESFSELIQSIIISASVNNSRFYENLLQACNEEVQAPIISQKAFTKASAPNKSTGNETGLLTLCDLLLEGATCQQICHEVHSLVLTIFISPLIQSWRVKDKIWRELGSLRLLHLIEGPQLVKTLPLFVLKENNHFSLSSPALAQIILDSLSTLRSDEDKEWNICLVGVCMIYSFIFEKEAIDADTNILSGRRSKFFYDMIHNSLVPDWLLVDILYFSECFIKNKFPFLQFLSTLKINLNKNMNNQNSLENNSIISESWSKLCGMIESDWEESKKVSRTLLQSNSKFNNLKILSQVIKIRNLDSNYTEIEIKDILKNSHRNIV
jgi:hypothetical protein